VDKAGFVAIYKTKPNQFFGKKGGGRIYRGPDLKGKGWEVISIFYWIAQGLTFFSNVFQMELISCLNS